MAGDSAGPGGNAGSCGFDPDKPSAARVYDYLLGGKDNFAADRDAAAQLVEALPDAARVAKANRAFLAAAVRYVASRGIDQYVDIGAGLPTSPNVHESAREAVPDARVAYVDNDPLVVTHARALLATDELVTVINGDVREYEAILSAPELSALIDLAKPVCVLFVSILHFLPAACGRRCRRRVPGADGPGKLPGDLGRARDRPERPGARSGSRPPTAPTPCSPAARRPSSPPTSVISSLCRPASCRSPNGRLKRLMPPQSPPLRLVPAPTSGWNAGRHRPQAPLSRTSIDHIRISQQSNDNLRLIRFPQMLALLQWHG